ncbi:GNAT family N-acetyltransferase, partial [Halobium palmae]
SGNDGGDDDAVEPIGAVTLSRLDGDRPAVGYWILPERQGEGFGGEAATLLLDHAFRTYDVRGVEAGAFDYNDASRALLESLGFVEESRRREAWFVDGAYRDEVVYGLLREEWEGETRPATDG